MVAKEIVHSKIKVVIGVGDERGTLILDVKSPLGKSPLRNFTLSKVNFSEDIIKVEHCSINSSCDTDKKRDNIVVFTNSVMQTTSVHIWNNKELDSHIISFEFLGIIE